MLAQKSDETAVVAPDNVLHGRRRDLGDLLLLLDIVEDDAAGGAEDEACGSAVEDVVGLDGARDCLDDVVREIVNLDKLYDELH